jgi:dihydroneopterin aldolase
VSDRITLTGLRVRGRHGVYEFERENGQDFVIDAELELDLSRPARTDEVTDTVHYGELADRLAAIVAGEPVRLIEKLADRLVAACLADERVDRVRLTVHKPQAPIAHGFTDVSVTLVRDRVRNGVTATEAAGAAGAVEATEAGAATGAGAATEVGGVTGAADPAREERS